MAGCHPGRPDRPIGEPGLARAASRAGTPVSGPRTSRGAGPARSAGERAKHGCLWYSSHNRPAPGLAGLDRNGDVGLPDAQRRGERWTRVRTRPVRRDSPPRRAGSGLGGAALESGRGRRGPRYRAGSARRVADSGRCAEPGSRPAAAWAVRLRPGRWAAAPDRLPPDWPGAAGPGGGAAGGRAGRPGRRPWPGRPGRVPRDCPWTSATRPRRRWAARAFWPGSPPAARPRRRPRSARRAVRRPESRTAAAGSAWMVACGPRADQAGSGRAAGASGIFTRAGAKATELAVAARCAAAGGRDQRRHCSG